MGLEKNNPSLNPIETGVLGDHTSLGVLGDDTSLGVLGDDTSLGVGFRTSSGLFLCKPRVYKFVT